MQTDSIILPPINTLQVLHTLHIQGPKWCFFNAYVYYTRSYNKDYNETSFDKLDEFILESFRKDYKESVYVRSELIYNTQQISDTLNILKGCDEKVLTIVLQPSFTSEELSQMEGQTITIYHLPFKLRIYYKNIDLNFIYNNIRCYIQHNEFDAITNLFNTMKSV